MVPMSFKRSPIFKFIPSRAYSPPRRASNHLRARASTGDRLSTVGLQLNDTAVNVQRSMHYKIFTENIAPERLQELIATKYRHPDEIDEHYDDVCVTVGMVKDLKNTSVVMIDVAVSPRGKWLSTGSDVYMHYLLTFRKAQIEIVAMQVESSRHVVDRLAAHNDYTLCRFSSFD